MFEKAIWKKSNGNVMMGRVMKIRRWKPKHSVTMPAVLSALSTARLSVFLSLSHSIPPPCSSPFPSPSLSPLPLPLPSPLPLFLSRRLELLHVPLPTRICSVLLYCVLDHARYHGKAGPAHTSRATTRNCYNHFMSEPQQQYHHHHDHHRDRDQASRPRIIGPRMHRTKPGLSVTLHEGNV